MSLGTFALASWITPLLLSHTGPSADYDSIAASARTLLAKLVAADTSNPPGNEARAAAIGAERLREAGIAFETFEFAPGRQNLVARLKGKGKEKPLLLLAHVDVVPAAGQSWTVPSHQLTEKDGYFYGRGAGDDLGMASLELEVLIALKRQGVSLRRDVILAWTGDEESGGSGVQWMLKNQRQAIDAELALNEGGGPVLGDDGKVKFVGMQSGEKMYQDFSATASGPTGHSSVPLSDNAIYRLAQGLDRLSHFQVAARLIPVTRAYFAERAAVEPPALAQAMKAIAQAKGPLPSESLTLVEADPVLAANLRTTCVATQISGGTRANALPAQASANINCRILPDETTEGVRERLSEALGDPAIEVKPVSQFGSAPASPVTGAGPDAIRKISKRMWPGVPVIPMLSRGATDSRFLRGAGIVSYGIDPIANTEKDARRAHGIDERIPVQSLRSGAEFLYLLVLELAATKR